MKKLILMTAIVMIACSFVTTAQQQEPSLKPTAGAKKAEDPIKLLLEINYNPHIPPAYATVNGLESKAKWIWVTRFLRIPGNQPVAGLPIEAVKLESQFNGETADVRVTLLRGNNGFEAEDLVGTYHVALNEEKTLDDLKAFGIEPFDIKLMDAVSPLPPQPSFENRTKAVEIVSVQLENRPLPAYRVTLRNLSDKSILGLRMEVTSNGRPGVTSLQAGEDGLPLMTAGGVFEHTFPVAGRGARGKGPSTAAAHSIVVCTAIFSDLSFEGELESACWFESTLMGRRIWLKQVLALLDQELEKPIGDSIEAARQFKEKFAALTYELDDNDREKSSIVSPACQKPSVQAYISPQNLRLAVLRDLDQIITTRPAPPTNFKAWLQARRERYKAWLARL